MTFEVKACIQNMETGSSHYFTFPTAEKEIRKQLSLGEDGEYLIVDYEGIPGINELTSIKQLNTLATKLEEIPASYHSLVHDWIVHYYNLNEFMKEFHVNEWTIVPVSSDEDFGEYLVKEAQAIKIPTDLEPYFNYQAYGRDCRLNFNCMISDDYYAWK